MSITIERTESEKTETRRIIDIIHDHALLKVVSLVIPKECPADDQLFSTWFFVSDKNLDHQRYLDILYILRSVGYDPPDKIRAHGNYIKFHSYRI